jgi:hypothetical protein
MFNHKSQNVSFCSDFGSVFVFSTWLIQHNNARRHFPAPIATGCRSPWLRRPDVSEATVRRDLHGLAAEGLLQLNHGGASVVRGSDHSFLSKLTQNVEAKQTIAQLAAQLVCDGEQLFLDSGTTCFAMTAFLRAKRGLSVIVNSIRTAQELAPGINVLMLGGQYRPTGWIPSARWPSRRWINCGVMWHSRHGRNRIRFRINRH